MSYLRNRTHRPLWAGNCWGWRPARARYWETGRGRSLTSNYQTFTEQLNNIKTKAQKTYYCLLSTAASWKTLGLSLSQSRETLMAGRGHSPMISSPRFLLNRARLHMTPRKDTEATGRDRWLYVVWWMDTLLWDGGRLWLNDWYILYNSQDFPPAIRQVQPITHLIWQQEHGSTTKTSYCWRLIAASAPWAHNNWVQVLTLPVVNDSK